MVPLGQKPIPIEAGYRTIWLVAHRVELAESLIRVEVDGVPERMPHSMTDVAPLKLYAERIEWLMRENTITGGHDLFVVWPLVCGF